MNTEFIQRWLAALADPEKYPQTRNTLRNKGGFCCWGVACDLAVQDGVLVGSSLGTDANGQPYRWSFKSAKAEKSSMGHVGYPPDELLEHMGIDPLAVVPEQNFVDHLAAMNDNGSNFEAIRSTIRELLKVEPAE